MLSGSCQETCSGLTRLVVAARKTCSGSQWQWQWPHQHSVLLQRTQLQLDVHANLEQRVCEVDDASHILAVVPIAVGAAAALAIGEDGQRAWVQHVWRRCMHGSRTTAALTGDDGHQASAQSFGGCRRTCSCSCMSSSHHTCSGCAPPHGSPQLAGTSTVRLHAAMPACTCVVRVILLCGVLVDLVLVLVIPNKHADTEGCVELPLLNVCEDGMDVVPRVATRGRVELIDLCMCIGGIAG